LTCSCKKSGAGRLRRRERFSFKQSCYLFFTNCAHFHWRALPNHANIRLVFLTRSCLVLTAASLAFVAGPKALVAGPADATRPAAPSAPPAVHLANISTRLAVGSGDNVLIAGFIITGTQQKRIIVRALGPTLPVNANLADPTLELHDSTGALISSNDNWRDSQQEELKATTIPPTSDYDAAIVKTLPPGAYTAVLAGKGRTTGVGVVEVYDLDLTADSKLANIATRGRVEQGDDVLIAGTIVLGNGTTKVLFRAIGAGLPVPGHLTDPTLELHDGQGATVATNDNWQDSQKAEIEATTIPPENPLDAAIIYNLSPGNYTAIVRGKNNGTGVAVVEGYQIN
jgi:hypothetical protein